MTVDLIKQDIYPVSLCDILRSVQIFEWSDFILLLKNQLVIYQSTGDLFSTDLIVNVDSQLEPNASTSLPPLSSIGLRESTSSPTIRAYNDFVTICINIEANYVATSVVEEKKLMADLAWETMELLQHQEFASKQFHLDTLCASPLLAEIADVIGMGYSHLNL